MAKRHHFYNTPGSEKHRPDSCRLGSGRRKVSYTSEEAALAARSAMQERSVDAANLEPYTCETHGWHLGNKRLPPTTYRVAERSYDLQIELGERVVAQLHKDNHQLLSVRLRVLGQRAAGAQRQGSG